MIHQPVVKGKRRAREQEVVWAGLISTDKEPWRRARDIRNDICQLKNRRTLSHGIQFQDHESLAKGMICGVLRLLMDATNAPRKGLKSILGVHETRISAVLDDNWWPPELKDLRKTLLDSICWMFLGNNWEEDRQPYIGVRKRAEFNQYLKQLARDTKDFNTFLLVQYGLDIHDYFFPFPEQIEKLPRFFRPSRREWEAPYDIFELSQVVEWVRRILKARPQRIAYIALFVATPLSAESFFSHKELVNELSFAPYETRGQLRIDVFHPATHETGASSTAFGALDDQLQEIACHRSQIENDPNYKTSVKAHVDWKVRFIPDGEPGRASRPMLRSIVSFMFVGYFYSKPGLEDTLHQRLYIVRPLLGRDERTPLSIECIDDERVEFVGSARVKYPAFRNRIMWLHSGGEKSLSDAFPISFEI